MGPELLWAVCRGVENPWEDRPSVELLWTGRLGAMLTWVGDLDRGHVQYDGGFTTAVIFCCLVEHHDCTVLCFPFLPVTVQPAFTGRM